MKICVAHAFPLSHMPKLECSLLFMPPFNAQLAEGRECVDHPPIEGLCPQTEEGFFPRPFDTSFLLGFAVDGPQQR